jgi:nucleoside-diphosphate-sugar epimerase
MSRAVHTNRLPSETSHALQGWLDERTPTTREQPVHALITGASGFIGMHLAERLMRQGKKVRLLVRRPAAVSELQRQGAEVVVGALDDVETISRAVEGVETVFHLAAMTSALRVDDMMRANGEGTRNIARACTAQQRKPLLVYVSSIAAAGPTARGKIRRETDAPNPISNYGRSKFAGEQAVASFAGDIPVTIVRPGIVFGPRNREMLPMFRTIKYGHFHPIPGWRTPALSLLHVDDTLEVIVRAAERGSRLPAPGSNPVHQLTSGQGVYFAAAPEYPDYAELGRMMRSLLRRPFAPVLPLMGPLPWLAAAVNEQIARLRGKSDSFNLDKIREARAESWACSGELAQRDLGHAPAVPLKERLASTVQWYREQRWL